MEKVTKLAYAKINLGLDVLRRRPDGYHEVKMIMQTVDIHDTLTFSVSSKPGISLNIDNDELPAGSDNLICKAAGKLLEESGIEQGVEIFLEKRIPIAAGMAGGSADAAATLHGLNELFELGYSLEELQKIAARKDMYIVVGTITMYEGKRYNSAIVLRPNQDRIIYNKRALWGWDRENFYAGNNAGIFQIADIKIGIRICFEVRFPEYFRELYREKTDLNIILFYDMTNHDDVERYELIQSHIRTRAVENVCPILTVNTNKPFQTAPTALYDKSGNALVKLERNQEALLIYDFVKTTFSFGEQGRKEISDLLINQSLGTKLS